MAVPAGQTAGEQQQQAPVSEREEGKAEEAAEPVRTEAADKQIKSLMAELQATKGQLAVEVGRRVEAEDKAKSLTERLEVTEQRLKATQEHLEREGTRTAEAVAEVNRLESLRDEGIRSQQQLLHQERTSAKAKTQRVLDELEAAKAKAEAVDQELQKTAAKLSETEQRLHDITALREEDIRDFDAYAEETQGQLQALRNELGAAKAKAEADDKELQERAAQLSEAEQRLRDIKARREEELRDTEAREAETQAKLQALRNELGSLQIPHRQLEEARGEACLLRGQKNALVQALTTLRSQLTGDLQLHWDSLLRVSGALHDCRRQLRKEAARSQELSGHVEELNGHVEELTGHVEELTGQREQLTSQVEELSGQVDELNDQLGHVTGELDHVTSRLEGSDAWVDLLVHESERRKEALESVRDELADVPAPCLPFLAVLSNVWRAARTLRRSCR